MNQVNYVRARVYGIVNSRLNRLLKGPLYYFARPVFLCFKLTERCNSKCVHCNIWHNYDDSKELATDDWIHIINNLREWTGPANLVITGGEALLRPDTLLLARHASHVGMIVELLSNGILCDEQTCKNIVLSGISQITISLDAITTQTHVAIRGVPNNLERIFEAVEYIDNYRKVYRSNIKILFKTVIMKKNIHEIIAIGDWINSQGKAEWRVQPIEQNYGDKDNPQWYRNSDLWITDFSEVTKVVAQLKSRIKKRYPLQNKVENLDQISSYFEKPDQLMKSIQRHNTPETEKYLPSNFEVSANGDVRFSFFLPPAGNLKNAHPRDIWAKRHLYSSIQS
jgi:MoaA/NifB/PqqE/SkfB family radical SAM enzyme